MTQKYDAIIIGSGIGGLTCGAFLAKEGMRILVLEQHSKIGGYAHNFKRREFIFESGIHSVPMSEDGLIMHLLRLLGVDTKIKTLEYPKMFSVSTPDFTMSIPSRKEEIYDYLVSSLPDQRSNIDEIFKEAGIFYNNLIKPIFEFEYNFTGENTDFASKYHNKSYVDFIDRIITDKKLRQLLCGQWPYVGASPGYSPNLFTFMMFLVHLVEGSHCCKDNFSVLASTLASVIDECGGEVKTRSRVNKIIADGNYVRGVAIDNGDEYEAGLVVSNITPYIVHNELIDESKRSRRWQKRLSNLRSSVSSIIVYLGMKQEVNELIPNNTHFWYATSDYENIFSNILNDKKETIDHLIFLKGIKEQNQTLTLMNFVQKSFSKDWKSEKMRVAEMMLKRAEEIYPGLNSLIEIVEVGSPATFERYTANTDGALYGFENTKSMYGEAKMPIITHFKNLFQTGHWGKPGCSIWNVMSNAYTASKVILKTIQ